MVVKGLNNYFYVVDVRHDMFEASTNTLTRLLSHCIGDMIVLRYRKLSVLIVVNDRIVIEYSIAFVASPVTILKKKTNTERMF